MTFQDIFKSSFLENMSSVSLLDMAVALTLAFGIGMFIFLIYKKDLCWCDVFLILWRDPGGPNDDCYPRYLSSNVQHCAVLGDGRCSFYCAFPHSYQGALGY